MMEVNSAVFRSTGFQWLLPVVILWCSVGCEVTSKTDDKRFENVYAEVDFVPTESEQDVQKAVNLATACQECVIFVHVNWAPMRFQGERFVEFEREFKEKYPESVMQFHYIDFTPVSDGYEPLRSLAGWEELGKNNVIHGYGEFVWLRKGQVLHVESRPELISATDLVAKSKKVLGVVPATD